MNYCAYHGWSSYFQGCPECREGRFNRTQQERELELLQLESILDKAEGEIHTLRIKIARIKAEREARKI